MGKYQSDGLRLKEIKAFSCVFQVTTGPDVPSRWSIG
jgi:hypothetical protein